MNTASGGAFDTALDPFPQNWRRFRTIIAALAAIVSNITHSGGYPRAYYHEAPPEQYHPVCSEEGLCA